MMMHLRIGSLLLLVGLHILGTNGAIVKRDAGRDLSGINSLRKQVGEYAGVAMPALEWDEGLVTKAKKMPNNCANLAHGSDFRVFPDVPDENAAKLIRLYYTFLLIAENAPNAPKVAEEVKEGAKRFIRARKQGIADGHKDDNAAYVELLNPAQNKIGCAPTKCTMTVHADYIALTKLAGIPKELELTSSTATFSSVCVLGPSNTWTDVDKIMTAITKADGAKGGKISHDMSSSVMASTGIISILLTSLFFAFLM